MARKKVKNKTVKKSKKQQIDKKDHNYRRGTVCFNCVYYQEYTSDQTDTVRTRICLKHTHPIHPAWVCDDFIFDESESKSLH